MLYQWSQGFYCYSHSIIDSRFTLYMVISLVLKHHICFNYLYYIVSHKQLVQMWSTDSKITREMAEVVHPDVHNYPIIF